VKVINQSRVVLAGDSDPLVNTADASCSPAGFPNVLDASASHTVELFQPSVDLAKDCGPTEVAPGDPVNYTITLSNTSSADTPDMVCTITDALLGINQNINLASGAVHVINQARNAQGGDPNPLVNTAEADCSPVGFPNQFNPAASCEVTIVGCALSPGFWGGGEGTQKWDNPGDTVAVLAGFYTGTTFPWLDASLSGSTYLEVLKLSALGDVTRQMSFKYIAARLNEAWFGVPSGTDTLLDQIDAYFALHPVGSDPEGADKDAGQLLLGQLNGYFAAVGEEFCPDPDTIPND